MKDIFPDIKSFSPTNIKYIRYFYEMYPTGLNRPQLGDVDGEELIAVLKTIKHKHDEENMSRTEIVEAIIRKMV